MATFIDFVVDSTDPGTPNLFRDFCECKNATEIKTFLDNNGYHDPYPLSSGVPQAECVKLMAMKRNIGFMKWPPPPAY